MFHQVCRLVLSFRQETECNVPSNTSQQHVEEEWWMLDVVGSVCRTVFSAEEF